MLTLWLVAGFKAEIVGRNNAVLGTNLQTSCQLVA